MLNLMKKLLTYAFRHINDLMLRRPIQLVFIDGNNLLAIQFHPGNPS